MVKALPEMTAEGAERITERIGTRLESIASDYEAVMKLIREALARNVPAILGYASPGAYAKDRFGDSLSKLSPELRREVSRELSATGMSTRAVGSVLGVNASTVLRDIAGVAGATPDDAAGESGDSPERAPVKGIDGKTYNPVITIKTKETHSTETVESFDAMSGAAVDSPAPDVPRAFLEVDQTFEDQKYVTSFVKAMPVAWTEFDPERIGRVADLDTLQQIDMSLASLTRWVETVKRSRPGLRAL